MTAERQPRGSEWLFLTAPDREALTPILAAYNKAVDRKADPAAVVGPLQHIFRAFLIDRAGQVRNIYSLDFFDPKLVLNDVRNLLLEGESRAESPGTKRQPLLRRLRRRDCRETAARFHARAIGLPQSVPNPS